MSETLSWERARQLLAAGLTVTVSLCDGLSRRERSIVEDLGAVLAAAVLIEELDAMARALDDHELAAARDAANASLAEERIEPVNRTFARLIQILMDRLEPVLAEAPPSTPVPRRSE